MLTRVAQIAAAAHKDLVILQARTLITHQELGQSDLLYGTKSSADKSGRE